MALPIRFYAYDCFHFLDGMRARASGAQRIEGYCYTLAWQSNVWYSGYDQVSKGFPVVSEQDIYGPT